MRARDSVEKMFDLVTLGHFSVDSILSPKALNRTTVLGGPPTYASLSARQLNSRVSVISKVGADFPLTYLEWLKARKVDLSGLKIVEDALTTSFSLEYQNGERRLHLKSRAPPILSEDILASMSANALHIAPIADELSLRAVEKAKTMAHVVSLDPQGFLRRFDRSGSVKLKKWNDPEMLEHVDIYKSSREEIKIATGLTNLRPAMEKICNLGPEIVIVTEGMLGSTLLIEGQFHRIPFCNPKTVIDPTGAGDTFIGAFLSEFVKGANPFWCACVGSAAASFVVEDIGPTVFGRKNEIYKRANEIYAPLT